MKKSIIRWGSFAILVALLGLGVVAANVALRGDPEKPVVRKPPPRIVPVLPSPKTGLEQPPEPTPPTVVEAPIVKPPVTEEPVAEPSVAEAPVSGPSIKEQLTALEERIEVLEIDVLEERITALEREFGVLHEASRIVEGLVKD